MGSNWLVFIIGLLIGFLFSFVVFLIVGYMSIIFLTLVLIGIYYKEKKSMEKKERI